ncbi:MAG: hypothetical protein NT023_18240 [Armatimonadetes bacterium]|nr:hypothetical protein [Armatimonadota bacterium]
MPVREQPNLKRRSLLVKPLRFKGGRFATLVFVAIFVLGTTLFLSNRSRRHRSAASLSQVGPSPEARERLKGGGGGPGEPLRANIKEMGPQPTPRYVANMATTTGEYVVSVRQVIGTSAGQNLLSDSNALLEQVILSIQVMALSDRAERSLTKIGAQLTAEDDQGKHLDTAQTKAPVRFHRGLGQLFELTAPTPNAKRLLSVSGEIVLRTEKGESSTLPFHLKNVFLPLMRHYYGTAALGYLLEEEAKQFVQPQNTSDFPYINSPEAVLFKKPFPPYSPEPAPVQLPTRVILSRTFPNELILHLPPEKGVGSKQFLNCTLRVQAENEGAIDGTITLSLPGSSEVKESRFRVWTGEAGLLLLPDFAPRSGKRLGLRLHLLSHPNQESNRPADYIPSAPFALKPGQRGALVSGQIMVGKAPVPGGRMRLEITPRDLTIKRQNVVLFFGESGEWQLGNFAPGVYRFHLDFLDVRHLRTSDMTLPEEYLRYRYGFHQIKIENQTQQDVEVRPGGVIRLKPFRLVEGGEAKGKTLLTVLPAKRSKPLGLSTFNLRKRSSNVTPAN